MGSRVEATPLAERIGAIAASRVASAVVMADDVIAEAFPTSAAGSPDEVMSAATAVVSGVTFAVTAAPFAVLTLATTEYNVLDTPDGSVAVITSGAVSPVRETLYVPFVPDAAEAVLPFASVTVTVAPVSAVPIATVPIIELAAVVVGWLDDEALELLPPPPPHAVSAAPIAAAVASLANPLV